MRSTGSGAKKKVVEHPGSRAAYVDVAERYRILWNRAHLAEITTRRFGLLTEFTPYELELLRKNHISLGDIEWLVSIGKLRPEVAWNE